MGLSTTNDDTVNFFKQKKLFKEITIIYREGKLNKPERIHTMKKYAHKDTIIRLNNKEWFILKEGKKTYLVAKDGQVARYNDYLNDGVIILYTPRVSNRGYILVDDKLAHRLVAKAWLPNPYLLKTVDHINADKENNDVSNLQWLTRKENTRKAIYIEGKHIGKAPRPITINGKTYISMSEAARDLKMNIGSISYAAKKAGSMELTI